MEEVDAMTDGSTTDAATTTTRRVRVPGFPASLSPERLTIIVDQREKQPWDLAPMRCVVEHLATGDYAPQGLADCICIERKSLPDLVGCVGHGRKRFEAELRRMLAFESRCVIVEASWDDLELGQWKSNVSPKSAVASVLAWMSWGVPFLLAGDRTRAQLYAKRFLFLAARRQYRRAREFVKQGLLNDDGSTNREGVDATR